MEAGEQTWRRSKAAVAGVAGSLEKVSFLDEAIRQDDQALYRKERAKTKYNLRDYKGAQQDIQMWLNFQKVKPKNSEMQDPKRAGHLYICHPGSGSCLQT